MIEKVTHSSPILPFEQTHLQFSRGVQTFSFVDLVRSAGVLRMWRGAPAVAAACIPSHAAYFSAYEWGKDAFGANGAGHRPLAAAAAGSVATILHDAVLTPMDVVKQRLQLGYYRGITHCISVMLREEGLLSFFRSYPTTLAMNVPYAAVAVATNESLKKILIPAGSAMGNSGPAPGLWTYLLSGAGAGAVAAAVTCPLDVIKTRLQTASLGAASAGDSRSSAANVGTGVGSSRLVPPFFQSRGGPIFPSRSPPQLHQVATLYTTTSADTGRVLLPASSFLSTARQILAEEGTRAFFKGAGARVMVHTPSMAISWSTYEFVKALLLSHYG